MKRIFFLLFAALLVTGEAFAQQPARFDWLKHFRGGNADSDGSIISTVVDNAGATYAMTMYRGTVSFSSLNTFSADTTYEYTLFKLNSRSGIIRATPFSVAAPSPGAGTSLDITGMELGPANSVYVTGTLYGQLTIGAAATPIGPAFGEQFLARIDSSGQLVWGKAIGSGFGAYGLAVDQAGNSYLGAFFLRTATVYNGTTPVTFQQSHLPVTNRFHSSALCASFDATGDYRWAKAAVDADTLSTTWLTDIAVDQQGRVFAAGLITGDVMWTGMPMTAPRDSVRNTFWLSLDANTGNALDYFFIKNGFIQDPHIAADAQGYSYLSSAYEGRVDVGGQVFHSAPNVNWSSYLARYDPNGALQWAQPFWADSGNVETINMTATPAGKVYVTGMASQHWRRVTHFGNLTFSQAVRRRRFGTLSTFVAAFDQQTGLGQWVTSADGGYSVSQGQQISVNNSGEIALQGYWQGQDTLRTIDGQYIVQDAFHRGSGNNYVSRILQQYNAVQGEAFVDLDGDNVHGPGESPYSAGAVVETLPDHRTFTTNAAGRYDAFVLLGPQTIAMPYPPMYYLATPVGASPLMNFSTLGNTSAGHDFALKPIAGQHDLRVTLTAATRARPGFPVKYRVTYRNIGTVAISSGTVTFDHDPRLTFLSTTGTGTHAGTTLTTTYTALAPGQSRGFDVLLQLPTNAPLGDTLVATANLPLANDLTPADNTETNRLRITGSLDPNDIQVNFTNLTLQQVAAGEWLEYVIRFQNMGTDTAFSILLRDSLPEIFLNLGTLELVASSHSCSWGLAPGGVLSVAYTSIRLPHRAVNTVGSMGFVRFRARTRTSLAAGDLIPNRAEIHFDFNAPMPTNTALTSVGHALGLSNATQALSGSAWPNPATDILHVEAALPTAAALHLTLLDAVGRPIRQQTAPAASGLVRTELDLRGLAAGLYLLRAEAGANSFTRRVVVK